MPLSSWKTPSKRTTEDKLLLKYWEEKGGIIFTEVLVGKGGIYDWPSGAKPRRIDGIQIVPSRRTNGLSDDIITFNKKSN